MSGKIYLKNRIPMLVVRILCMSALSIFLLAIGNSLDCVLFILFAWIFIDMGLLFFSYRQRKKELDKFLSLQEQLEEKYLIPEMIKLPRRADDQVFYSLLRAGEKSMLEQIERVYRERAEYKDYVEQWIHEVKTPLTAMKLLCENHQYPFTRELSAELEKTTRFTEQALYYARSGHPEKDYSIREIHLLDVVHGAIADNKYLLRRHGVSVNVEEFDDTVFSDEKWIEFILNQLIINAVKYRTEQPKIRFYAKRSKQQVCLYVEDNGIGIPESDLPRIFEKGFTGENGRVKQNATGIGLYLCRKLCDKLGIAISAVSGGEGATFRLSFYINDFIHQVQDHSFGASYNSVRTL